MKKISALSLLFLHTISAQAQSVPHLDLEMTGAEYRVLFNQLEKNQGFQKRIMSDPLNTILELGKRNLDWVAYINQHRDNEHKLQLTTPETTTGTPIDKPSAVNRSIILNNLEQLKQTIPQTMAHVLFETGNLPEQPPVDDTTFIEYARLMNRIYESASRWLLQEPDLELYSQLAVYDIRGYYFLNKESNLIEQLTNWSYLDTPTQNKYSQWLIGECINSYPIDKASCQNELHEAINNQTVASYHQQYVIQAKHTFDELFEIKNPRPEAIWNSNNPDVMEIPFTRPIRQDVEYWFKINVEDEFKFDNWKLLITYSDNDHLGKVEFEEGATPHVDELGGDTIVMDANQSLNEYASNWTIRHEFGHVLGFPDCYMEFYDKEKGVMIQYQVDTTNLMCSRRGSFQKQHYAQLKKHYYQ